MKQSSPFKHFMQGLRATAATCPDPRKGKNKGYTLVDAALGAFAVCFYAESVVSGASAGDASAHGAK